jgi:predicted site-specific integrase-resolvase
VSWADQKADLDQQVARVSVWATEQQIPVDKVIVEVGSALAAQGRGLIVVDAAEVDGDLVWDMPEILTSMCARLCGTPAGGNRAKRAPAAVAATEERGAP